MGDSKGGMAMDDYERKKKTLMNIAYAAVAIGIYFFIFRYAIYAAWPFVFSLLFAMILRKPTLFLASKLKMNEKLAAALVLTLFYVIVATIVILVGVKAFWAIIAWIGRFPVLYSLRIEPFIEEVFAKYTDIVAGFADETFVANLGNTILDRIGTIVTTLSSAVVSTATSMAKSVPGWILGVIFMIISSFFIAMDYRGIKAFFLSQLNPNQQQIAVSSKEYLGSSIGKLILSYGLIMFITFCELNIGLRLLDVENPTVVSFLIALFDILPALGTGGIVIPWIIIELFSGELSFAFGLFIMYIAITVIRNVIEPKIVGDNIGIHPVFMLISIYMGAYLLGVLGIIIMPFTLIVIKQLNDSGLIHVLSTSYRDEPDYKQRKEGFFTKLKKTGNEEND